MLQNKIPVSVGVSIYQAVGLMQRKRVISSGANNQTSPKARQLLVYCSFGVTAGVLAGLLGVGGGAVMGPMFLELGIPPQVSSATATFAMMFSSSIAVAEYYLLHRFPVPYAIFFTSLAFLAAIVGQQASRKLMKLLGRASFIIFILSFVIFISAVSLVTSLLPLSSLTATIQGVTWFPTQHKLLHMLFLGGVGISKTIHKMARHEYMGFDNIC